jgi:fructose-1,6-bisphosphatase/inositol monophosphatase family enzyme
MAKKSYDDNVQMVDWLKISINALDSAYKELKHTKNALLVNQDNIKITADRVAHAAILKSLKSYNLSCNFYSEETRTPKRIGHQPPEIDIVVDPLDGSYFYLKGANEFCSTGLMVIKNEKPVLSAVKSLKDGYIYYCDEHNSYSGDRRIKLSKSVVGPPAILVWAPMKRLFTDVLHKLDPLAKDCRIFSNCGLIHAAQIAEGYYDAIIELQEVPLYEFCGAVIAWRAGAILSTLEGKPIIFDPTVRQTLVVSRSANLHDRILNCFIA